MKIKKHLWQVCLLTFSIVSIGKLCAQNTLPNSKWTLGVDFGVNLGIDCGDCDEYTTTTAHATSAHINYRVARWFGLTGNVGFYQQQLYSNKLLWDNQEGSSMPAQRNSRINLIAVTGGPKFMFRIGQGDLAFELRYGLTTRMARTEALVFSGQSYDIKYKPVVSLCSALRLGYTYWPKPRFGISAALEITNIAGRRITFISPSVYESRKPLAELYPDESPETLSFLAPDRYGPNFINVVIGVHYRL